MCGFIYNVTDYPLLIPLFEIAGYDPQEISEIIKRPHLRPTDTVLTIVPTKTGPKIMGSTWWLATKPDGSVNTSVTSFNSRSTKVGKSKLHLEKPRSIRSVVIGSGFCEWQPIYQGGLKRSNILSMGLDVSMLKPTRKVQHLVQHESEELMLFGAVSKLRVDEQGFPKVNTSIITLPSHSDFSDIHAKSFPLVLRQAELNDWLNPAKPYSDFEPLLDMNSLRDCFSVREISADLSKKGPYFKLPPKAN